MISVGGEDSQQAEVAHVASTIFGRAFSQDQVVDETLARSLDSEGEAPSPQKLTTAGPKRSIWMQMKQNSAVIPSRSWLENLVALEECEGHLVRRTTMGFSNIIEALAEDSGAMGNRCRSVLESLFQWVCAGNQRIRSLTTALNLRLPNLRKVMTVAYCYHLPVLVGVAIGLPPTRNL